MKRSFFFVMISLCLPFIVSAKTIQSTGFGANIHLMQRFPQEQWSEVLSAAHDIGVASGREEFSWNRIEPENDVFDWSTPDAAVDAYADADMQMLGLLTYSASWATSVESDEHAVPNLHEWEEYVRAVVTRYAGRVEAWEIWNEPNHDAFFSSENSDYVYLVQAAAIAIRESDPDAHIVLGGLAGVDTAFLDDVLPHISAELIDVVAVHPYRVVGDNFAYAPEKTVDGLNTLATDMTALRAALERNGYENKAVWLTEFGYPTHSNGVTEKKQARLLARAFTIAFSSPHVKRIFWYSLVDAGADDEQEDRFGLLTSTLEQKQSAQAFAFLVQHLTGKTVKGVEPRVMRVVGESSTWSVNGGECTESTVSGDGLPVTVTYVFTGAGNCYLPVDTAVSLGGARAILIQLSGAADHTMLRVRITDSTGETLQYTLGHMSQQKAWYRIDLGHTSAHWGGNDNGDPDGALTLSAIVFDNQDGELIAGNATLYKMRALDIEGVHAYRFTQGSRRSVVYWSTAGKHDMEYAFTTHKRVRVYRFGLSALEKEGAALTLRATRMPKMFSVQ